MALLEGSALQLFRSRLLSLSQKNWCFISRFPELTGFSLGQPMVLSDNIIRHYLLSNLMPIPDFAPHGALPPFLEGNPTEPNGRSPYVASMQDFVERFCTNAHRAKLLKGLNEYRKHLFKGGFVSGLQWLDGSFIENVETTRNRPPADIDVVTLFNRPIKYQSNPTAWGKDYAAHIHNNFFDTHIMKPKYSCDSYSVDLDAGSRAIVRGTTYWFGLFTDVRGSDEKKGIVEIPLATDPLEFIAVDGLIGGKYDV